MSKKLRRNRRQQQRRSAQRQMPWLWLALGGAIVAILGVIFLTQRGSAAEPQVTPEVVGGPRLRVDQTEIDEGYIKHDVPVRTTFHLSNVGDQPLKIIDTPQVRLVEGC